MTLSDFFAMFRRRKPLPAPLSTFETVSYGSNPLQAFDEYVPPNTYVTDELDAIVFVHGGGFVDGDKDNPGVADIKSAYYNGKGKIFVSVNYRLDVSPEEQGQDLAAAVKAVQVLPGVGRVILMAHSAGGTDAALAVVYNLCSVWKVILLDPAALDSVATMQRPHDPVFAPLGDTPEEWARNSPMANLTGLTPPWFIATSNERSKAFLQQANAFATRAQDLGGSATVQAFDLSHEDCNKLVGTPCPLTDAIDNFLSA